MCRLLSWLVLLLLTAGTLAAARAQEPPKAPPHNPEVLALLAKAREASTKYRYAEALEVLQEALTRARTLNDRAGEATTLNNIGEIYRQTGRSLEALKYYEQALPLQRAAGSKTGEAVTLNNIGRIYSLTGQPREALRYYEQSLALRRETGDRYGEAVTLNSLGHLSNNTGQRKEALQFFEQALALLRELGDRGGEASTLSNIGLVYGSTGRPREALRYFEQALPLRRETGDKAGEAVTLGNIGAIYGSIGQPREALRYYEQSLPLRREVADQDGAAATLTNIGEIHREAGQPQEALKYYEQALSLRQAVGNKAGAAAVLSSIGLLHSKAGHPQEALKYLEQSLSLRREAGDRAGEANTLHNLAGVYSITGRPQEALGYYEQALPLRREVGDTPGAAATLSNLAALEKSLGRTAQARQHLEDALALLEEVRDSLGELSAAKQAFLGEHLQTYHRCIELLLALGDPAGAFAWVQKTKGRALLDLMAGGAVDLGQSLTPEEREREQALKDRISLLNTRLLRAGARQDKKEAAALGAELQRAESELRTFTNALYVRRPGLADQRVATTVSLPELGRFLPADTALLDYIATSVPAGSESVDRTVLFCVTLESGRPLLRTYAIPRKRAELAALVDRFRVECGRPDGLYRQSARDLYRLLIAPAAAQLAGKKRLILCPDGPLWGLPFQALIADGSGQWSVASRQSRTPKAQGPRPNAPPRTPNAERRTPNAEPPFLLEQYELVYAYSATAAGAALRSARDPQRHKPGGTLLALADPDFGPPERFGLAPSPATRRRAGAGDGDPVRAVEVPQRGIPADARDGLPAGGRVPSLPGTAREAQALRQATPDAVIYTREKVQESTIKAEAGKYRYLHFATHGLLNSSSPLQSGLLLSQPASGSADDGLLTAQEIFELKLAADLVVLSACETGRGRTEGGEGLVGLTWALFVAGSPSQVVSQWKVADRSTAGLMGRFYWELKAGKGKGTALRAAALSLRQDGQHSHPFYWAPFILVGDWRPAGAAVSPARR